MGEDAEETQVQKHVRIKQYNVMTMMIIIELGFTEWLCATGTIVKHFRCTISFNLHNRFISILLMKI